MYFGLRSKNITLQNDEPLCKSKWTITSRMCLMVNEFIRLSHTKSQARIPSLHRSKLTIDGGAADASVLPKFGGLLVNLACELARRS